MHALTTPRFRTVAESDKARWLSDATVSYIAAWLQEIAAAAEVALTPDDPADVTLRARCVIQEGVVGLLFSMSHSLVRSPDERSFELATPAGFTAAVASAIIFRMQLPEERVDGFLKALHRDVSAASSAGTLGPPWWSVKSKGSGLLLSVDRDCWEGSRPPRGERQPFVRATPMRFGAMRRVMDGSEQPPGLPE